MRCRWSMPVSSLLDFKLAQKWNVNDKQIAHRKISRQSNIPTNFTGASEHLTKLNRPQSSLPLQVSAVSYNLKMNINKISCAMEQQSNNLHFQFPQILYVLNELQTYTSSKWPSTRIQQLWHLFMISHHKNGSPKLEKSNLTKILQYQRTLVYPCTRCFPSVNGTRNTKRSIADHDPFLWSEYAWSYQVHVFTENLRRRAGPICRKVVSYFPLCMVDTARPQLVLGQHMKADMIRLT